METKIQPVTRPFTYPRSHQKDGLGGITPPISALQIIAYVKSINPRAKLIPNSKTYNYAVKEYNFKLKNSLIRPEVPEWFCGNVTSRGVLVDPLVRPAEPGDSLMRDDQSVGDGSEFVLSEYPMDGCVISGGTPGSPGYVNCLGAWNVDRDMGPDDFWSDFVVEYSAGAFGSGGAGCIEENKSKTGPEGGGVMWCYGGVNGSKASQSGDYEIKITGRSGKGFNYTTSSDFGKWKTDGGNLIVAAFFLVEGKWKGGKFEWIRPGSGFRGFENITSGYQDWYCDAAKESSKMKVCMLSADGRKRTKIVTY